MFTVSRKISAAAVTGILVAGASYLAAKAGVVLSPELTVLIGTAASTLVGWLAKEKLSAVMDMDLIEPTNYGDHAAK